MKGSLQRLLHLLSPRDRRRLLLLLGMMIVAAGLEVVGVAAIPAFVGLVADQERLRTIPAADAVLARLAPNGGTEIVVWGALGLGLVFAVKTGFLIFNNALQMRFVAQRRIELAGRLLRAYMSAPFSFHLLRNSSELLRNVERETGIVAQQVIGALLELGAKLLILMAVLGFLMVAEPIITLFWIGLFGSFAGFVVLSLGARLKREALKEQAERKTVVQALTQGFGGLKEARVLGREAFFLDRVLRSIERMAWVMCFKQSVAKSIPPVTELTAILGLLVLTAALVTMGRPTESILVTLSLFVVALVRLKETMSAAMTHVSNLRYNLVSIDPVYEDLQRLESGAAAPPSRRGAGERLRLSRRLSLHDVWLSYEDAAEPALKGVSLCIPAGAAIGFVGPTGAGKSTLVDVILGLLPPDSGEMRIDGVPVRPETVSAWQGSIGYVPQAIYLLDDTIRRNVALGLEDSDIDEEAVLRAVETAQLGDLLARLPKGLDTWVGEHGARLSGGERQRIGIARALYHDPDVLILDEATSALDTTTERAVVQAVEVLKGGRTVIMIAHRLSTVKACDTLYYLRRGRIEAEGPFAALQERHAEFAAMASS